MIYPGEIKQMLNQHAAKLRDCLRHVSKDSEGPEEGSDAWLLLDALLHYELPASEPSLYDFPASQNGEVVSSATHKELLARFTDSGRWLAEQGGRLDARIQGLQSYIDALTHGLQDIFRLQPHFLLEAYTHLSQIHSASIIALTSGYQSVIDQRTREGERLAQQLEHRLSALRRINGVSNSNIDLDQALAMTARFVAEELHADLCSIFFYDDMQRTLTLRATNGPRPLGGMHSLLRLGEGYSGWVADKGRPLLVRDALADPHFSSEAYMYGMEYHGLMALPVIFFGNAERLIGVVSVQSLEPRDFTSEEVSFVEVVAGIIAINIENGRLYEQTDEQLRRKVHELATIHRVSSIIASTLNLDEVLQIITTQAVHLSGAERSCIFELDTDRQHLHVLAHYGLNSSLVGHLQIKVGQCCAGRTVQTGQPNMAVDCYLNDGQCFMRSDPYISSEIHSVLCVPLAVKSKVIGCICIYSNHRHLLSHEQMQLVVTFANEAAIAIENARLYEETRRGLELKSILLRELHHRVKNNLATVAGILSLQRRRTKSSEVQYTLAESVNRVQGLAATHDLLAHEDVSEARVDDIARKIVGVANANLRPPETHITFRVDPCAIVIPSRAVTTLALALNEMVSNAIKHGMVHMITGMVMIRGREEHGYIVVQVLDNGRGPLKPMEEENGEGLGVSLIKHLIGDLGGQFTLRRLGPTEMEEETARGWAETRLQGSYTVAEVRFPVNVKRVIGEATNK